MGKIFNPDNPVFVFMGKIADLIMLNIVFILFCLPIFTIGASWTALMYVTVKMVKKEESYVIKDFWHSFKDNFKQATLIWLLVLLVTAIFTGDFLIYRAMPDMIPKALIVVLGIMAFILFCAALYVFPLLSHYENTIKNTIKNYFIVSLINVPYTILFMILFSVPYILLVYFIVILPAFFMLGFSVPAYIASIFWNRIFAKIETKKDSEETGEEVQSEEDTK